jgi:hypothetical protein
MSQRIQNEKRLQDMAYRPAEFAQDERQIAGVQSRSAGSGAGSGQGKPPSGYRWTDDGNLSPIPGGPAEKPTETQRVTAGYADRMEQSAKELNKFGEEFNLNWWEQKGSGIGAKSFLGRLMGNFQNTLRSPEGQEYLAYANDWIRAKLRRESGAAIPPDEWQGEWETYFPAVGDSLEVLKAKAKLRAQAEKSMRATAGHGPSTLEPDNSPSPSSGGSNNDPLGIR